MSGRLLIAIAALLWSTGGAAVKLSSLSGTQLVAGRAVVAGLVLFVLFPKARRGWSRDVWIGGVAYAATCTLFIFANTLTTAGNAIFLQNIAPAWVLLLSPILLNERATFAEKLTLPVSLAGCLLFFVDDVSAGSTLGNGLAVGASFSYATVLLFYRRLDVTGGIAATLCGNLLICVFVLPFSFDGPAPQLTDYLVVFHLGAIQQAGAAMLYVRGIRELSAMEGALLVYLEPVMSPVWAFLAVGERLTPLAILGGALIVGGAIWRTWYTTRSARSVG
ncbi:MAG: DMT family transporter [Deltaproteobacteria bacterium]